MNLRSFISSLYLKWKEADFVAFFTVSILYQEQPLHTTLPPTQRLMLLVDYGHVHTAQLTHFSASVPSQATQARLHAQLLNCCSRAPTEREYFAPVIVCILCQNLVSKGILSHSLFSHQQSIYSLCFLHSCCGHAQLPAGF